MVIEMIDGQPPYFDLTASEAMACIRDLPSPTSKKHNKVMKVKVTYSFYHSSSSDISMFKRFLVKSSGS
jgi:hypothetical protein